MTTSSHSMIAEQKARVMGLLTDELFVAWLEAKPADEVVGECQAPTHCPIFRYLTQAGVQGVGVTPNQIEFALTDPYEYTLITPPLWVHRFVRSVDRSGNAYSSVTAQKCLEILSANGSLPALNVLRVGSGLQPVAA